MTDSVVLAGGGVAGIAWETGILHGLAAANPAMARWLSDQSLRWIGTSAGSAVAAQVTGGRSLTDLYADQRDEVAEEIAPEFDPEALEREFAALAEEQSRIEALRRLGRRAKDFEGVSLVQRMEVIASRLPATRSASTDGHWPNRPLLITAVDCDSGERVVFDSGSGATLAEAVAASCAVPLVWPAVPIASRTYMDGGTHSGTNADLAAGSGRVLVLVPAMPQEDRPVPPENEMDALADAKVSVIFADEAAITAIGPNSLDPATRPAAAAAGRELGARRADEVAAALGLG